MINLGISKHFIQISAFGKSQFIIDLKPTKKIAIKDPKKRRKI